MFLKIFNHMSGAAGGSRINKEDLKATIRSYRDNVLKPLGLNKSYSITGVRSRPEKHIFGDIDVVVSFPEGDKKELKQQVEKKPERKIKKIIYEDEEDEDEDENKKFSYSTFTKLGPLALFRSKIGRAHV